MNEDELTAMETSILIYARKNRQKIDTQEASYREREFKREVDK